MNKSRSISSSLTFALIIKTFTDRGFEEGIGVAIVLLIILSMIWYNDFWANRILVLLRWAPLASDFRNPSSSSKAVAFLGWIILLLIGILFFLKGHPG